MQHKAIDLTLNNSTFSELDFLLQWPCCTLSPPGKSPITGLWLQGPLLFQAVFACLPPEQHPGRSGSTDVRLWTQLPWGRERRWKNVTFTASHFWLQALFPQSLIHWTRKCFLAPIINMKGVDRALELWLERELGWRCIFPDGGVSLDVKTKRSMWGLGVN